MTDHDTPESPASGTEKKTFDIYHFFSRTDMLLAGAVILLFLILLVCYVLFKPVAV